MDSPLCISETRTTSAIVDWAQAEEDRYCSNCSIAACRAATWSVANDVVPDSQVSLIRFSLALALRACLFADQELTVAMLCDRKQ